MKDIVEEIHNDPSKAVETVEEVLRRGDLRTVERLAISAVLKDRAALAARVREMQKVLSFFGIELQEGGAFTFKPSNEMVKQIADKELQKENERLREALEVYADDLNWQARKVGDLTDWWVRDGDGFEVAREALK